MGYACRMSKTVAELRNQAAALSEDVAALRARVVRAVSDWKPGEPVPFEISNAFDRLLRTSAELHDALEDLAARDGK